MIVFPNAKINLGLNIVSRREDGFHDIETILMPVSQLRDILEVIANPTQNKTVEFYQTGLLFDCSANDNLCIKAYKLLSQHTSLPKVTMHLHKQIPVGAGLGGGSADGAFALKAINSLSPNPLAHEKLLEISLELGSDCPFFILNSPSFATGRGEKLHSIHVDLNNYFLLLVNPGIHVNTGKAYSLSTPKPSSHSLVDVVKQPIHEWKDLVTNDFERAVFELYPEIEEVKERMYEIGALYAAMSGSGSTVFGIFREELHHEQVFGNYFAFWQKVES